MMKKNNINANSFADLLKSTKSTSYAPLSKSVCAAMLAGAMVLGGGYSFLLRLRMLMVM
ncbi:hypothetical protein [Gardnerella sp. Marseille-QA0894]|uniref:hypothetical protein n=1 Tax=Gardnerella sp. Marseille-QA0894 TaxID=3383031 RepID=UPI003AF81A98